MNKALAKKSEIIHSEKLPSNNVTIIKQHSLSKNVFTHPHLVYTIWDMKDEIIIWENGTKKDQRKYYLTMFMQEAYKIYTELPVSDKVTFPKFCDLCPKKCVATQATPFRSM